MGNCTSDSSKPANSVISGYTFTHKNYDAFSKLLPVLEEKSYWFASSVDWRTTKSVRNKHLSYPYDLYRFTVTVCMDPGDTMSVPSENEKKAFHDQLQNVILEAGFTQNDASLIVPFLFGVGNKDKAPIELDGNRHMIGGYKKQIAHSTTKEVLKFDPKVVPNVVLQYIQNEELASHQ
jgi:hypothetical protein